MSPESAPAPTWKSGATAAFVAGQDLAESIDVILSKTGKTRPRSWEVVDSSAHPLAGLSVSQVLAIAHRVLAGDVTALPPDMSIVELNDVMARINDCFDSATRTASPSIPRELQK